MDRRTAYTLAGLAGAVALCAVVFGRAPQAAASSARVPTDPGEVLESLPFAANDARSREISGLRRALAQSPRDLPRALRLARLDIQLSRERSDPRYLGHAQAALAPWWSLELPPVDVLVLRATIEQSLHDFEAALLDLAVRAAPDHAQAWLTRAVLTVRGRYAEARESCAHLVPLASNLVVTVCQTGVDSVTGHVVEAHARIVGARADRRHRGSAAVRAVPGRRRSGACCGEEPEARGQRRSCRKEVQHHRTTALGDLVVRGLRGSRNEPEDETEDRSAERVVDAADAVLLLRGVRAAHALAHVGVRLRRDEPVDVLAIRLPGVLRRHAGAIGLTEEDGSDSVGAERRQRLVEARGRVRCRIACLRPDAGLASVEEG